MDILLNTPYVIRVLVSLVVILVINKVVRQLLVSLLIGALFLALWSGHALSMILEVAWTRFSSVGNLFLMGVIFQVIWLSSQMSETGIMTELVEAVKSRVSQRTAMAVLPAIIGLLPMPGGAVFSAPLVEDCDHNKTINPVLKTQINYWFRHIWEFWWPLYPGVILAMALSRLPMQTFMVMLFPMTLFAVAIGYNFLLRKIRYTPNLNAIPTDKAPIKKILLLVMPIIIVILVFFIIKVFLPGVGRINQYLPMMMGILCAQVFLQFKHPLNSREWRKILFSTRTITLALLAGLIRVYGAFIEARLPDGTLLMAHVRSELSSWHIPLTLVIVLIPFVSALTTGLAVGFVGASFPIVMTLIGNNPGFGDLVSKVFLAYVAGYMGMILSPVHVCFIVTNEYFKTRLLDSLVKLGKPVAVIGICGMLIFFLLRLLLI